MSGKGGVGKTTISAVLSRALARRGRPVVAVDCDSDPNLAVALGAGEAEAGRLRPLLDQSGADRSLPPSGLGPLDLLRRYGHRGPDGVTVLVAARAEKAGSG